MKQNFIYGFEKLDVWKLARDLNKFIYQITKDFPTEEKFGLTSQVRRATVSISSNIAEGSTRFHSKDQARFYQIAYGSAVEVLNQCILATDLEFMNEVILEDVRIQISSITFKLNGLIKNLNYQP